MSQTTFTTHTAPLGESITIEIRKLFGLNILTICTNFHPVDHIHFANTYIASLPGLKRLASIQFNKDNTGTYSFLLENDCNREVLQAGIKKEFDSYFSTLQKNAIK